MTSVGAWLGAARLGSVVDGGAWLTAGAGSVTVGVAAGATGAAGVEAGVVTGGLCDGSLDEGGSETGLEIDPDPWLLGDVTCVSGSGTGPEPPPVMGGAGWGAGPAA